MPAFSPALISVLTVSLNGVFCLLISILSIALPDAPIFLSMLTGICGVVYALASWLPPLPAANSFWLMGVLPLGGSAMLYFLLASGQLSAEYNQAAGYTSLALFFVGTLLPTVLICLRKWQLERKMATRGNQQDLVAAVRREVEERLDRSLHNAVLVNLVAEKPTVWVRRIWDVEVKIGSSPTIHLPPGKRILDVFEGGAIAGKLLVLGAPGSGKTTTLLELAYDLCDRQLSKISPTNDATALVPVLFDLATWNAHTHETLVSWLVAQLQSKYSISVEIGQQWLTTGQVLPLLDGLDELDSDRRERCIQSINQLRKKDGRSLPVVVSIRIDTYKRCQNRLRLFAALKLRPLSEMQIQDYLMGARSRELWQAVQEDPALLEFAKTPLFLNVMTLAHEEILIHSWKRLTSKEDRRQYLFNAYIRRQLSRQLNYRAHKGKQPLPEQTRHWLSWLAKKMKSEAHTEFAIENIPPTWLPPRAGQLRSHAVAALLFGMIYGLIFAIIYSRILGIILGGIFGIIGGLCVGTIAVNSYHIGSKKLGKQNLAHSAIAAVIFALIGWLIFLVSSWQLGVNEDLNLGLKSLLILGTILGPIVGLIGGLLSAIPCLQYLTLRFILWRDGSMPWNYSSFLNYATERLFLQRVAGRYRFIHGLLRDHFSEIL